MSLSDRVRFLYVCPLAWNRLTGDDRARFCADCQKTVTNLSEMSAVQAEVYLQARTESVCVRIERDASGRTLHWPDLRAAGVAVALATAATACAPGGDETGGDSGSGGSSVVTEQVAPAQRAPIPTDHARVRHSPATAAGTASSAALAVGGAHAAETYAQGPHPTEAPSGLSTAGMGVIGAAAVDDRPDHSTFTMGLMAL